MAIASPSSCFARPVGPAKLCNMHIDGPQSPATTTTSTSPTTTAGNVIFSHPFASPTPTTNCLGLCFDPAHPPPSSSPSPSPSSSSSSSSSSSLPPSAPPPRSSLAPSNTRSAQRSSFAHNGLASGQWSGRARKQPPAPLSLHQAPSLNRYGGPPPPLPPPPEEEDWEPLPVTPLSATRRGRASFVAVPDPSSGTPASAVSATSRALPTSSTMSITTSIDSTEFEQSSSSSFPLTAHSSSTNTTSPPGSAASGSAPSSFFFKDREDRASASSPSSSSTSYAFPSSQVQQLQQRVPMYGTHGTHGTRQSIGYLSSMHPKLDASGRLLHHGTIPMLNSSFVGDSGSGRGSGAPIRARLASDLGAYGRRAAPY